MVWEESKNGKCGNGRPGKRIRYGNACPSSTVNIWIIWQEQCQMVGMNTCHNCLQQSHLIKSWRQARDACNNDELTTMIMKWWYSLSGCQAIQSSFPCQIAFPENMPSPGWPVFGHTWALYKPCLAWLIRVRCCPVSGNIQLFRNAA